MIRILNVKSSFFDSEESKAIKQRLQLMADSVTYNTQSSYTANGLRYPDNLLPFVDKHMNYLSAHPQLDAGMYLRNLRLMTRIG